MKTGLGRARTLNPGGKSAVDFATQATRSRTNPEADERPVEPPRDRGIPSTELFEVEPPTAAFGPFAYMVGTRRHEQEYGRAGVWPFAAGCAAGAGGSCGGRGGGWGRFGHSARRGPPWCLRLGRRRSARGGGVSGDPSLVRQCAGSVARRCRSAVSRARRLAGCRAVPTIPLRTASDIVPPVGHQSADQTLAVDGGRMERIARILGCGASTGYACLTQFSPAQIPSLIALANRFVVSDATFEARAQPSWGSHLELVAGRQDGFVGDNPFPSRTGVKPAAGWGCDSHEDAMWHPAAGVPAIAVPACVPERNGFGSYRRSPVPWVPTVMDHCRPPVCPGGSTPPPRPRPGRPTGGRSAPPSPTACTPISTRTWLHPAG